MPSDSTSTASTIAPANPIRRVLRNSGKLVSGSLISAAAGLLCMSITIKSLGAATFGILVMIQAYSLFVGDLFTLQCWQAITRHGEEAIAKKDKRNLADILRFGFRLDLLMCTLGAVFAASTVWIFSLWQEWPSGVTWIACLYSLAVLFKLSSTPISVFNLFGRYGTFSRHAAWSGVLRLVAIVIVAMVYPTLEAFALVNLSAIILALVAQFWLADRILREHQVPVTLRWLLNFQASALPRKFRKSFTISAVKSSLSGTVRIASTHLVTLGVGSMLGTVAVASYRLIQVVGQVLIQLAMPLMHSTYPEFVAANRRKEFATLHRVTRSLDKWIAAIACAAAVAFLFAGRFAIAFWFGEEFTHIFWSMLAFMMLEFFGLSNSIIIPRLWSLDRHGKAIVLQIIASAAHLAVLVPLGCAFGIPGIVASYLVYHGTTRAMGALFIRRYERLAMEQGPIEQKPSATAECIQAASVEKAAA